MSEEQEQLVQLAKFDNAPEAEELQSFLKEKGVESKIEDVTPSVDLTFQGNSLGNEVLVKVNVQDFDKAEELLEGRAARDIKNIPDDYYLFQFSDEELMEVIEKADEWSNIDHQLALQIFKSKGREFTKEELEGYRNKRIEESQQLDQAHPFWIFFGFFSAACGGLFGIWIGMYYWQSKSRDLEGSKFYSYNKSMRKTGMIMATFGFLSMIGWIITWIALS